MTRTLFDRPIPEVAALAAALKACKAKGKPADRDTEFAASLVRQYEERGKLSEKQMPYVTTLTAKLSDRATGKEPAPKIQPRLEKLAHHFLTAAGNLKFPKLRMETQAGQKVVLTRCGPQSRTPGHINVTDGGGFGVGTYFGRISPAGHCEFRDNVTPDIVATLKAFDADPAKEAKVQGIRTGSCCCCGRELTNAASIALGIGPICAERWGI